MYNDGILGFKIREGYAMRDKHPKKPPNKAPFNLKKFLKRLLRLRRQPRGNLLDPANLVETDEWVM